GAAQQQLGGGEAGRCPKRFRRMRSLHGPNSPPQPVHPTETISVPAEEGSPKMDVGLDQARKDVASARLNDSIVRFFDGGSDCRNTAVTDRDLAIDYLETGAHGYHDAATYEKRHRSCSDLSLEI